jgi:adenylate kinase
MASCMQSKIAKLITRTPGVRSTWARSIEYMAQASSTDQQAWRPPNLLQSSYNNTSRGVQIVLLGPPGVGKGALASRLSSLINVPHIAMGDLVRNEISQKTAMAEHMKKITGSGQLLPDHTIFNLLVKRLQSGGASKGFILDGCPRTLTQAEVLGALADIDLAVNLRSREDVLVAKCLGRRICSHCGGTFNVADVAVDGIRLPALLPPPSCASKFITRADDRTEEVVRARMRVHHAESGPVEEFYRSRGLLVDFDVRGGIQETWSRLVSTLEDKKILSKETRRVMMSYS